MLRLRNISQTAKLQLGELLVTAGVGGNFPKGIPVGIVTAIDQGHDTLFQRVNARPLISARELEEVAMLQSNRYGSPLLPPLVGPPEPIIASIP